MKYSQLGTKTLKGSKEFDSVNATYLTRGGFIHMTMAGAYTFLPLGLRVLNKIENIIRTEMNTIASELLMTALAPKNLWEQTGRLETVDVLMKTSGANEVSKRKSTNEYILNSTHEELITPIAQLFTKSYKDFPCAFYQIQTKFRNEARAKSGILRGREFRMKDLYSFHTSEADLMQYYEKCKEVYTTIFQKLGLGEQTVIALASGGDFTKEYSHEFQTRCAAGEDTIYRDKKTGICYNEEVAPQEALDGSSDFEKFSACEVGNIFPLGTKFSSAWKYTYTNEQGKECPVYMGSYGIGPSRLMGVLAEVFHDEKGIVWPKQVAPFHVYLASLPGAEAQAHQLYEQLVAVGVEVLFDDRDVKAGTKLTDADLLGIPVRLVMSAKTEGKVEWKKRSEDTVTLLEVSEVVNKLTNKN